MSIPTSCRRHAPLLAPVRVAVSAVLQPRPHPERNVPHEGPAQSHARAPKAHGARHPQRPARQPARSSHDEFQPHEPM